MAVSKEKTRHWLEWKGSAAVQAHETGRLGWPGGRGVRGAGTGEAPRTCQTRGAASGQQSGPTPEGRKEGIKRRSDSTSLKTTEKIHDARSRVRHSLMGALSPCGPGPLPWAASPCALQACWGSCTIAPPPPPAPRAQLPERVLHSSPPYLPYMLLTRSPHRHAKSTLQQPHVPPPLEPKPFRLQGHPLHDVFPSGLEGSSFPLSCPSVF